ncbi:tyrosyl-tRNA synthetase [Coelomomyces lativittatus]|nr:tyrosyl-tRNA synthetase [Coelomomyces lativittatus]KAJ1508423.1 tyrosyl-tRNA synthetase [Coelomomyces lativittatus]
MAGNRLSHCVYTDLKLRNAIHQVTSPFLCNHLKNHQTTLYFGVDPTSDSVHIGNLLPIITSFRFLLAGNPIIALIGGATASIGDPSGRSKEREPLSNAILSRNELGIRCSLNQIFENLGKFALKHLNISVGTPLTILNNKEWLEQLNLVDFLRNYGSAFRVSSMLHKDSVKSRLKSEVGISLAEFMYQSLQAYDFYYLYKKYNCQLQIGGSDQWGNIVSGMDLIYKKHSDTTIPCYGLTLPLILSSSGQKYSKSADNALWLDSRKTIVYDFYQFFKTLQDAEVEKFLKYFTFYSLHEIEEIMREQRRDPSGRVAQTALAKAITEIVHGGKS